MIIQIHKRIWDEKVRLNITTQAATLSALSLGQINTKESFTGKEILFPDQIRTIEHAKST